VSDATAARRLPQRQTDGVDVHGDCDEGFGAVADEFARNFRDRGEVGAACAVYRDGRKVVDLWGGFAHARHKLPWEDDTLVMMFSTTKGVSATALAVAQARGLLDYDAPVASYWPEFAEHGKGEITVRQLLAHQAGLPAIAARLSPRVIGDSERLAAALAAERPAWKPGTRHGYHMLSLGWYEGELLRRVDPRGRTLGRFFQDELARPLGLEFYIGLPRDIPERRVARLESFSYAQLLRADTIPRRMLAALAWPTSITARTVRNPRLRRPADLGLPDYRVLEVPAGGGIGQVRSVARLYADLATGGRALGLDERTFAELTAPVRPPTRGSFDMVLKVESAYALGYIRPVPRHRFGSGERAFGHPGAGGSFAFADPDARLAFAYAPNKLGFHLVDDPRELALRTATYRSL
jgi:CubicO group peptidase (beta-lactamase class C family)